MTPRTEQWADAYRAGQTIAQIARAHRVASSVVQRALSRAGVPMRGPGRAPRSIAPRPRPRAPGRPAGTHTQAVRVLRLVGLLAEPRDLDELASELQVSARTVRRDLEAVREVFELRRADGAVELGARRG